MTFFTSLCYDCHLASYLSLDLMEKVGKSSVAEGAFHLSSVAAGSMSPGFQVKQLSLFL